MLPTVFVKKNELIFERVRQQHLEEGKKAKETEESEKIVVYTSLRFSSYAGM